MEESIGFIGLGKMGGAIAERLLINGKSLVVFDSSQSAISRMKGMARVTVAGSPQGVANACKVVVACLPSPDACVSVVRSILQGTRVQCYVETSTIGLKACRDIGALLKQHGIGLVDAPVSGGPKGAAAGKLSSFVAAPLEAFDMVEPVIASYSGSVLHVAELPGLAQICKLVNNAISLSTLALASEAAVVGVAAGLDPQVMIDAINASSGRSATTVHKFAAAILTRSFDYGASVSIAEKDMALFLQEARSLRADTQGLVAVHQLWRAALDAGLGAEDFTSIIRMFERTAGVVVGR